LGGEDELIPPEVPPDGYGVRVGGAARDAAAVGEELELIGVRGAFSRASPSGDELLWFVLWGGASDGDEENGWDETQQGASL